MMPAISSALVVGGGIGGLTAAIALAQAGVAVDLVEIHSKWTVHGVGIVQPTNMLRELHKIGVAEECIAEGMGFLGWRVCDENDRVLQEAPVSNAAAPQFPAFNGIKRPVLHQILIKAAEKAGATLRLGVTVEALEDRGDRVSIQFSDGGVKDYGLVVGCDGIYSDIRRRVFGNAAEPFFVGQGVWRYNLPRPEEIVWNQLYWCGNTKVGLVPISKPLMYIFLLTPETSDQRIPQDQMADRMRERLEPYGGLVGRLREQIVDADAVVYKALETLLLPDPWHKGRTIIIGDAAHSATPHINQGAAMAIEDAVLLGELMRRDEPLDHLLSEFMSRRFHRAALVTNSSHQIALWEVEEWNGVHNPSAKRIPLMNEVTASLLAPY